VETASKEKIVTKMSILLKPIVTGQSSGYVDPADVLGEIYDRGTDPDLDATEQGITPSFPCETMGGTTYFQHPGCAIISSQMSHVRGVGVADFLRNYGEGFEDYQDDPTRLRPATEIAKFVRQARDFSLGENRIMNVEAVMLFQGIIGTIHDAALEHISFGFLLWGISRSVSRDLLQARAGVIVTGLAPCAPGRGSVRFVEPPEYQNQRDLHRQFCERIDTIRQEYEDAVETLARQLSTGPATEDPIAIQRVVHQAAQSILSNDAECPLIITANFRAWRAIFDEWLSPSAEPQMRNAILRVWLRVWEMEPLLVQDYRLVGLSDGTYAVTVALDA
jgi:thymidylate synthase (FAD)